MKFDRRLKAKAEVILLNAAFFILVGGLAGLSIYVIAGKIWPDIL